MTDYLPDRDIDFLLQAARVSPPLRDAVVRLDAHLRATRDLASEIVDTVEEDRWGYGYEHMGDMWRDVKALCLALGVTDEGDDRG